MNKKRKGLPESGPRITAKSPIADRRRRFCERLAAGVGPTIAARGLGLNGHRERQRPENIEALKKLLMEAAERSQGSSEVLGAVMAVRTAPRSSPTDAPKNGFMPSAAKPSRLPVDPRNDAPCKACGNSPTYLHLDAGDYCTDHARLVLKAASQPEIDPYAELPGTPSRPIYKQGHFGNMPPPPPRWSPFAFMAEATDSGTATMDGITWDSEKRALTDQIKAERERLAGNRSIFANDSRLKELESQLANWGGTNAETND